MMSRARVGMLCSSTVKRLPLYRFTIYHCQGVHVLTWSKKKNEEDSWRGGKAAKIMIRTSMITLIPKVWLCRGGYNVCAVTTIVTPSRL